MAGGAKSMDDKGYDGTGTLKVFLAELQKNQSYASK